MSLVRSERAPPGPNLERRSRRRPRHQPVRIARPRSGSLWTATRRPENCCSGWPHSGFQRGWRERGPLWGSACAAGPSARRPGDVANGTQACRGPSRGAPLGEGPRHAASGDKTMVWTHSSRRSTTLVRAWPTGLAATMRSISRRCGRAGCVDHPAAGAQSGLLSREPGGRWCIIIHARRRLDPRGSGGSCKGSTKDSYALPAGSERIAVNQPSSRCGPTERRGRGSNSCAWRSRRQSDRGPVTRLRD